MRLFASLVPPVPGPGWRFDPLPGTDAASTALVRWHTQAHQTQSTQRGRTAQRTHPALRLGGADAALHSATFSLHHMIADTARSCLWAVLRAGMLEATHSPPPLEWGDQGYLVFENGTVLVFSVAPDHPEIIKIGAGRFVPTCPRQGGALGHSPSVARADWPRRGWRRWIGRSPLHQMVEHLHRAATALLANPSMGVLRAPDARDLAPWLVRHTTQFQDQATVRATQDVARLLSAQAPDAPAAHLRLYGQTWQPDATPTPVRLAIEGADGTRRTHPTLDRLITARLAVHKASVAVLTAQQPGQVLPAIPSLEGWGTGLLPIHSAPLHAPPVGSVHARLAVLHELPAHIHAQGLALPPATWWQGQEHP